MIVMVRVCVCVCVFTIVYSIWSIWCFSSMLCSDRAGDILMLPSGTAILDIQQTMNSHVLYQSNCCRGAQFCLQPHYTELVSEENGQIWGITWEKSYHFMPCDAAQKQTSSLWLAGWFSKKFFATSVERAHQTAITSATAQSKPRHNLC